jgi:ABC-type amino acid transport substrate-binding protein
MSTQPQVIGAMLEQYPHLDHLMAETILQMHENGTLGKMMKEWDKPNDSNPETFPNAVRVEKY